MEKASGMDRLNNSSSRIESPEQVVGYHWHEETTGEHCTVANKKVGARSYVGADLSSLLSLVFSISRNSFLLLLQFRFPTLLVIAIGLVFCCSFSSLCLADISVGSLSFDRVMHPSMNACHRRKSGFG